MIPSDGPFFFPLKMLERVDLTYMDPTWKRIEAERFTLRLQTLYMIWWYLGSEIKNQNLSILTSLKIKVTNDKWDQFEDHFFQKFFFLGGGPLVELFGDQCVFFAEFVSVANRENHQKSSELIWENSMWFFFGKIQVASFVAFCFSTSPEGKPQCFAGVVDDEIGMI